MPQVPYQPVPQIAPTEAATPRPQINAPIGAFGGEVAQAIQGLGAVTERAGNELFGRAVALKQLDNETEARDADSQYMIQAGQLHADYSALTGLEAKNAFPKYQKDLEEARVKLRASLSNPMAQKLYDASSLSTLGRSIFNGAGHAATEFKSYTKQSLNANIDLDAKTTEDSNGDLVTLEDKLDKTRHNVAALAGQEGAPVGSPIERDMQFKASSKIVSAYISGVNKTKPFEAGELLGKYQNRLSPEDYAKLEGQVTVKSVGVGGTNLGNSTVNDHFKNGVLDVPVTQLDSEIRDKATKQFPDNPEMASQVANHAIQTAHTTLFRQRAAEQQDDQQNLNLVYRAAIASTARDEQELLTQHPELASAIGNLHNKKKELDLSGVLQRAWKARTQITNDDNATRLNGIFNNKDSREEALNMDLTKEPLSHADMMKFIDRQAKLRSNLEGDPRVDNAVKWMQQGMGAQLEALGIYSRDKKNPDLYDHFRGATQAAIDAYVETYKKAPSYKEFMDNIAPQLLRTRNDTYAFGLLGSKRGMFDIDVPEDLATRERTLAQQQGLPIPSDAQIYKKVLNEQFKKFYGAKPKDQSKAQ